MMLRAFLAFLIALAFSACTSGPDIEGLPQEKHTVVILGGSTYGVTVASALKSYDEAIDVVLVEPGRMFVTEPYLNLYLSGMIDEKLVFRPYDVIAKRHGFTWIGSGVTYLEPERKMVVVNNRIIRYQRLVDARYRYLPAQSDDTLLTDDYQSIIALEKRIGENGDKRILIDATALPAEEKLRGEELYNLLKNKQGRHVVFLQGKEEQEGSFDLLIRYPRYEEDAALRFSENFFSQFNRGLETAAEIVREDLNGSFLPNMVKEERFVYQNAETLQGIDPDTNQKKEGTEYLAKVIKIQRDFM